MTAAPAGHQAVIDRRLLWVFSFCLSIELSLVILDYLVNWNRWSQTGAIRRLFNITREDGLASLFAVLQTFVVALVCWCIYLIHKSPLTGLRGSPLGWLSLAVFFTYLAIDDGAMVHERIGTAFSSSNRDVKLPSYGWQVILAPAFVLAGILVFRFLWRLGAGEIRRDWLVYALACLGTAVGIDFIEGTENGFRHVSDLTGLSVKTVSHFSKSIEEFIEMLGMTFFLILFLRYLMIQTHYVTIVIANASVRMERTNRS